MNTNAAAYKKIGDSIKKKYKESKFHKNNPNMFKGGDAKIHPGAKKDSSKDAPSKKKLTYEERLAARKARAREVAKKRTEQFKIDRAAKKAGKKTSYEGYKSAYDKRQAEKKERAGKIAGARNTDYKAYKKGNMSLSDFIKKHPNSVTAREAKKKGSSISRKLKRENKKNTDPVTNKKTNKLTKVNKKDTKTTSFMKRGGVAGWVNRKLGLKINKGKS